MCWILISTNVCVNQLVSSATKISINTIRAKTSLPKGNERIWLDTASTHLLRMYSLQHKTFSYLWHVAICAEDTTNISVLEKSRSITLQHFSGPELLQFSKICIHTIFLHLKICTIRILFQVVKFGNNLPLALSIK